MNLERAEEALGALSCERPVGRNLAIIAALELLPFAEQPGASRHVRDAHCYLQRAAEGEQLELDNDQRRYLAQLAGMVRSYRLEHEALLALMAPEVVVTEEPELRYGTR